MTQASDTFTNNGRTVIGVFDNVDAAERAINDLKVSGFTPDSISVVTRDRDTNNTLVEDTGVNQAGKGAVSGALGGGTLGAVLGWLLAGGTALIPGVGPIIAAGVLGATVTGALVGGSIGSIASALAGSGIPEEHAREYEEHIRGGRTLVSAVAPTGQMVENAHNVFERNNAVSVRDYANNTAVNNAATPSYTAPITTSTTTTTTDYTTPTTNTTTYTDTTNTPRYSANSNIQDNTPSAVDANTYGTTTNQSNPTQNTFVGGPSGSGTNYSNTTYNVPSSNTTETPGTRYSEPFTDRERNIGTVADSDTFNDGNVRRASNTNLSSNAAQTDLPDDMSGLGSTANPSDYHDYTDNNPAKDATNFEPMNDKPMGNI